jgi:CheY-like chemotaxis protein
MSGYGTDRDVEEAKAAGFEKHFTKPFNFAELFAEIERMVS